LTGGAILLMFNRQCVELLYCLLTQAESEQSLTCKCRLLNAAAEMCKSSSSTSTENMHVYVDVTDWQLLFVCCKQCWHMHQLVSLSQSLACSELQHEELGYYDQ
jgi:hypothetical protein